MDIERVKEILESDAEIDVYYHNAPVWIESILDGETVSVSFLDSKEKGLVQAEQLEEG